MAVLNCQRHATAPTPVSGVATWRTWGWHTWHVSGDKRGNQVPLLIVPSDHYDHHHCCTWYGTVHTAQCVTTTRTTNTQASQLQSSSQWGNFFYESVLPSGREQAQYLYVGCWWMLLCCQKLLNVFPTSVKAGILEKCKHVSTSLME